MKKKKKLKNDSSPERSPSEDSHSPEDVSPGWPGSAGQQGGGTKAAMGKVVEGSVRLWLRILGLNPAFLLGV